MAPLRPACAAIPGSDAMVRAEDRRGAGEFAVPALNRSTEAIGELVTQISGLPTPGDDTSRRRVLDVLDDLAEEMIGRIRVDEIAVKQKIEQQRERFGVASPGGNSAEI